jgi:hypothetical protein
MASNSEVLEASRKGFSKNPLNYDKTRPEYSLDVFNESLNAFNLHELEGTNEKINVLDLAAGTGKFTKYKF